LPARRALKISTKLAKIIGPAIGALGDGFNLETGEPVEGQTDSVSKAVKLLVGQIDDTKIESLILDVLQTTVRIDPQSNTRQEVSTPKIFDEIYAGNFAELAGALVFALEVSVGDFFGKGGISGLISRMKTATDKALSRQGSPTASIRT
jgi:hypothetical protein